MNNFYDVIFEMLYEEEGYYDKPYLDSRSVITVGIGTAETRGLKKDEKMLLGVEEIKDIEYIDFDTAKWLCMREVHEIVADLSEYDWFSKAPQAVKLAITDFCYNCGIGTLMSFTKTLEFIKERKYVEAGVELLDSKYMEQVKGRAIRISTLLSTGKLLPIDECRKMYKILKKRL